MKGLKTLVIGMGLLIVIGLGLIGYGLSRSKAARNDSVATTEPQQTSAKAAYFASDLPLPRGGRVQSVTATSDRVLLHVTGTEGGDRILLLDPHNGQLLGSITLLGESH